MPNNRPIRKYFAIDLLVRKVLASVGGFWGWLLGIILTRLFNWLAMRGVYFIDVGSVYIQTNMDEKTWISVVGESYEKVEAGVSEKEGKEIDEKFIKAFNNFTVFKRVKK